MMIYVQLDLKGVPECSRNIRRKMATFIAAKIKSPESDKYLYQDWDGFPVPFNILIDRGKLAENALIQRYESCQKNLIDTIASHQFGFLLIDSLEKTVIDKVLKIYEQLYNDFLPQEEKKLYVPLAAWLPASALFLPCSIDIDDIKINMWISTKIQVHDEMKFFNLKI